MRRTITQRELRKDSGRIMRALDKGKSFVITRKGVAVGELVPLTRRMFVSAQAALAAFARAPRVEMKRFRRDATRSSIRIRRFVAEHRHRQR